MQLTPKVTWPAIWNQADIEAAEERAAIKEFDGRMPRREAERQTIEEITRNRARRIDRQEGDR